MSRGVRNRTQPYRDTSRTDWQDGTNPVPTAGPFRATQLLGGTCCPPRRQLSQSRNPSSSGRLVPNTFVMVPSSAVATFKHFTPPGRASTPSISNLCQRFGAQSRSPLRTQSRRRYWFMQLVLPPLAASTARCTADMKPAGVRHFIFAKPPDPRAHLSRQSGHGGPPPRSCGRTRHLGIGIHHGPCRWSGVGERRWRRNG